MPGKCLRKPLKRIYDHLFIVIVKSSGGDTPASYWDENYAQPYFDNTTRRDITVTIGQTALLHCRVRNLGDRAVSSDSSISIQHISFRIHAVLHKSKAKQSNNAATIKNWSGSALSENSQHSTFFATAVRRIVCGPRGSRWAKSVLL